MQSTEKFGLEFPCNFSVKAMGLNQPGFERLVFEIVAQHVPNLGEDAIRTRLSSAEKYISVNINFEASSRRQLDNIYQALTDHERVIMSL